MNLSFLDFSFLKNFNIASFLNFTNPSWDLFIGILFVVISFLYAVSFGRNRSVVALASIYMGFGAVTMFPISKFKLADILLEGFYLKTAVFSFFTIVAFLLLSNSFISRIFGYAHVKEGKWWQVFLYSFLHIGLLIMIVLSFFSERAVVQLAPMTTMIFTTEWSRFIWMILPISALIFIRNDSY